MISFCTYFDKNYLVQGLTLIRSLSNHYSNLLYRFYILCLDDLTYDFFSRKYKKNYIVPLSLKDIEARYPELKKIKKERGKIDFYWTLTPFLIDYVFDANLKSKYIMYLDADIYFFDDLKEIIKELRDKSILLCAHNFHFLRRPFNLRNGKFNVGVNLFKRDIYAKKAINFWKNKCLEWCFARIEEGKFGDQIYLEDIAKVFKNNVKISTHYGINLGPWSVQQFKIYRKDHSIFLAKNNNQYRLICYHFHQFRFYSNGVLYGNSFYFSGIIKNLIYKQYEQELKNSLKILKDKGINIAFLRTRPYLFFNLKDFIGKILDFLVSFYTNFNKI